MKKKNILVDVGLTVLFLIMMGYHHTGDFLHEWFGICLFILFVVHNFLNRKWYSSIFKGKYNMQRTLRLVINILLTISFLVAMVSGIMMSQYVFGFLNLQTTMLVRRAHMAATSWSFILMSIHFGLHWSLISSKLKSILYKNHTSKMIFSLLSLCCILFGCIVFYQREFWNEMFLLVDFVFMDFQESAVVFFIKEILLMSPFIFLGSLMMKKKKFKVER